MSYWQDRYAKGQTALSKKSEKQIQKQMSKYYANAAKSVIDEFEKTYNHLLLAVEEGRQPTPADLYKLEKYWEMTGNLRKTLNNLSEKEIEMLTRVFRESYSDIYNGLDLPSDVKFSTLAEDTVQQIITSVWCADGKSWSDRVWDSTGKLAEALNEELINTILTGKKTTDLKKRLQEQFNVNYAEANRLVRTELAHIQTAAAQQRYKDSGVMEVEIWADEDERRCKTCGKLHQKRYSISAILPIPAHPNCRCCVIPRLDALTLSKPNVNMNYSKLVEIPAGKTSGSNEDIREWYYINIHDIPNRIDYSLPLEQQAKQASDIRNQIKIEARKAMKDRELADKLNEVEKPKTLDQLINSKMYRYQMTREEALKDVIRSASITNESVDNELFGG